MTLLARLVVICGALAWLSLIAAIFTFGAYSTLWWCAVVVILVFWAVARVLTRDVAEKPSDRVDEYEALLRGRAHRIGYWTSLIAGVFLVILFSLFVNFGKGGDLRLLELSPDILMAVVIATAALPTFVLVWATRPADD